MCNFMAVVGCVSDLKPKTCSNHSWSSDSHISAASCVTSLWCTWDKVNHLNHSGSSYHSEGLFLFSLSLSYRLLNHTRTLSSVVCEASPDFLYFFVLIPNSINKELTTILYSLNELLTVWVVGCVAPRTATINFLHCKSSLSADLVTSFVPLWSIVFGLDDFLLLLFSKQGYKARLISSFAEVKPADDTNISAGVTWVLCSIGMKLIIFYMNIFPHILLNL